MVFVKNVVTRPNITVGEYTYYDDKNNPEKFEDHVTHHYEFLNDKLIIGKFCSIASGIEFVMNGANHVMEGITTYPFNILGGDWADHVPTLDDLPLKGDTVVGNDVWFGQNVTVMPGVKIHDGAIVAANTTVVKDVEPYSIVGGNPSRLLKYRFSAEEIQLLEKLAWWNKDINWISEHIEELTIDKVDVSKLHQWIDS
ncbi:Vat family streptogramin A O-acetyltransferase [Companilactobacillus zhachilii]|uniref:Vat family streptogramin A O-acetyltransferase n=1 Tax=Companilactobacillus zhachilii TaxID=2304606 RepID=UPI0040342FAD